MSLFDVLRYPISNSPTENELLGLPESVFKKWQLEVGWMKKGSSTDIYSGLSLMTGAYRSAPRHQDIVLLRKMIAEYESI